MTVLVLLNQEDRNISAAGRSAITAGLKLSTQIDVFVVGVGIAQAVTEAASISGVAKVNYIDFNDEQVFTAENVAKAIESYAATYSHVVAPAVTIFKNSLPRVAGLLDLEMVSEVTEILSEDRFVRPLYAGSINGEVQSTAPIKLITIRPTSFGAAKDLQDPAPVEEHKFSASSTLSTVIETRLQRSERPSLGSARVIVTGGRSLGSAEQFSSVLNPLASKFNAAIGATRAAVDAGFAANDAQVGQTGTVVAPDIYLAFGVSGAAQHIAGIKGSKLIVAVNHDPEAQIFQWADYGLVADLFETAKTIEEAF